jgi:hypothetical protein
LLIAVIMYEDFATRKQAEKGLDYVAKSWARPPRCAKRRPGSKPRHWKPRVWL